MQLYTNRLLIRPFLISDLPDVYEYCSQDGVGTNAGWAAHKSPEESGQILGEWISAGNKHAIVLLESDKVVGHISVDPDSEENRADTREIGCALNLRYQRKGIMTEALQAVLEYLFESDTAEFVWACCFQSNAASKGMIEKCGFKFVQNGVFFASSLGREFPSYEYRISKSEWQQNRQHK